jgi:catechol 2,3-dioxygenase-like lactoylglutathione lyase family enzyme
VRLRLGADGPGEGIVGWRLQPGEGPAGRESAPPHPNGAIGVDHVVMTTPDFDRTLAELEADGFELRRIREAGDDARQAFYVVGPALLEVVGPRQPGSGGEARFWGVTFVVADLDATAALLGDRVGTPREAVQPGRRIATVRRDAGLGTAVAFMTPRA